MRLVLYLYARFLLSVLYTVLVIPRDLQIPARPANGRNAQNINGGGAAGPQQEQVAVQQPAEL